MSADRSRTSLRAGLALLVVTLIWGGTFVWMKEAVEAGEQALGPGHGTAVIGLFMALRFGLAALVMPLCVPGVRRRFDGAAVRGGALLGIVLLAGFLLQMLGLEGVSPAVSAFLTSLYVLFTALLQALRERRLPGPWLLGGALLATLGAAYIEGPPELTYGLAEWLTIACAFVFAVHILVTDAVTRAAAPLPVTWVSFVVVALGSGVVLTVALGDAGAPSPGSLGELAGSTAFLRPLLLSSLLATAVAITLMNLFQREMPPVRAAILYALEPVWATLYGLATGHNQATLWLLFGGAALLAGNLIAELGPRIRGSRGAA